MKKTNDDLLVRTASAIGSTPGAIVAKITPDPARKNARAKSKKAS